MRRRVYAGLGFEPNDKGLRWDDSVPFDLALAQDPPILPATDAYFAFLRGEVLDIAGDDPGFVLHTLSLKTALTVRDGLDRYLIGLLLAAALALAGPYRRHLRVALLMAIPFALVGLVNPVIALPIDDYELGLLGTLGALQVLAAAAAIALVPAGVRALPEASAHAARARERLVGVRPRAWGVTAVVGGLRRRARPGRPGSPTRRRRSCPTRKRPRRCRLTASPGPALQSWTFGEGAHAGRVVGRARPRRGVAANVERRPIAAHTSC